MNDEGWTLAIYDKYEQGQLLMDQPDTYTTFTGGHNQMEGSFYADQNFDKPTSPMYLGQKE